MASEQGTYANISTNGTFVLNPRQGGILRRIVVNTAGATSAVTVYDNTAGSGTTIATTSTLAQASILYDLQYANGLTVVTTGGTPANITVVYT